MLATKFGKRWMRRTTAAQAQTDTPWHRRCAPPRLLAWGLCELAHATHQTSDVVRCVPFDASH
jgi:hypothetical protein